MAHDCSSKRIVICCDGTWQASDRSQVPGASMDSNVTKFSRAIAKTVTTNKHTIQQIVYYVSGIGTNALTKISSVIAGGLGLGLEENVIEAYNFLAINYAAGDEIFLFGFSRGAYTARALAGFISSAGVVDTGSLEWSSALYQAFKEGTAALDTFQSGVRPNYKIHDATIKVIGCWDTVGSLGIPKTWFTWATRSATKRDEFFNTDLSDKIENAFHALALEEHRAPFTPTLWNLPEHGKTNLVQCWFPGVHISVGGGDNAKPREGGEQLAEITYTWMLEMCRPFLEFDSAAEARRQQRHDEMAADTKRPGWGLGTVDDSYVWYYRAAYQAVRTPGQYNPAKNNISDPTYVAQGSREYMHASVRIRNYLNLSINAMSGFQLVLDPDEGKDDLRSGWKWVKKLENGQTVEIPEIRILGDANSAERGLMSKDSIRMVEKGITGE